MYKKMKTRGAFLFFSLCLALYCGAQVGINTMTPAGVFHVAAGGDSLVISSDGNVGVGVSPASTVKLDILSDTEGGALQIVDGLQQEGHLLTSDSAGNARWSAPIGSAGQVEALLRLGPQTIGTSTSVYTAIPTSSYTVKADGYHVFEIRWYARYATAPSATTRTGTHLRLMKHELSTGQDIVADQYEMRRNITADATDAVTFWVTLSVNAKAGDILSLQVRPSLTHANLLLRNTVDLETTKIIVKRLNVR
jgi:hypothetical protein